jgi:hypothetical protein
MALGGAVSVSSPQDSEVGTEMRIILPIDRRTA